MIAFKTLYQRAAHFNSRNKQRSTHRPGALARTLHHVARRVYTRTYKHTHIHTQTRARATSYFSMHVRMDRT